MRGMFRDRKQAGKKLAARLGRFRNEDPVVLALPRGGVPVAFEVARALIAPLDIAVVRKIGAPGRPELGIGAVGEGGSHFVDSGMVGRLGLTDEELRFTLEAAQREVEDVLRQLRGDRPSVPIAGRTVILVDDGIATGGTMRAAIRVARAKGAATVIVGVPVAGPESLTRLTEEADEVVCVEVSPLLWAIGLAYEEFEQVPTETVKALLDAAREHREGDMEVREPREVLIDSADATLQGDLTLPSNATGLVIFAHGSGSSRRSRRNQHVARFFQEAGMATLLFDLLSYDEQRVDAYSNKYRFDIDLLARRMIGAVDWARSHRQTRFLPKACFGASTGAAAALAAAAERPADIAAVVSRGGRPDLAKRWLSKVRAPCLFLVGERDQPVLEIHSLVLDRVPGHTHLAVIHGAGHLFEEPGAIDEVGRRATEFLRGHLRRPSEVRP